MPQMAIVPQGSSAAENVLALSHYVHISIGRGDKGDHLGDIGREVMLFSL